MLVMRGGEGTPPFVGIKGLGRNREDSDAEPKAVGQAGLLVVVDSGGFELHRDFYYMENPKELETSGRAKSAVRVIWDACANIFGPEEARQDAVYALDRILTPPKNEIPGEEDKTPAQIIKESELREVLRPKVIEGLATVMLYNDLILRSPDMTYKVSGQDFPEFVKTYMLARALVELDIVEPRKKWGEDREGLFAYVGDKDREFLCFCMLNAMRDYADDGKPRRDRKADAMPRTGKKDWKEFEEAVIGEKMNSAQVGRLLSFGEDILGGNARISALVRKLRARKEELELVEGKGANVMPARMQDEPAKGGVAKPQARQRIH